MSHLKDTREFVCRCPVTLLNLVPRCVAGTSLPVTSAWPPGRAGPAERQLVAMLPVGVSAGAWRQQKPATGTLNKPPQVVF